jgi:Tfp pilus assembly protein PilF
MDQKRWEPAAAAFRAAAAKPDGEQFVTRQYTALVNANKTEEANRLAADWIKQHPKNPLLLRHLAGLAYNAGDRVQARAYYEQALEMAPKDVAMLNNLAWILVEAKDPKALALAQRAAALAPDHPNVLDTLAQAYALNNDYQKAIEALRRAVHRSATAATLRLHLARLYIASGDRASAKAELETLRDLGRSFPERAEVLQLLARIH